MRGSREAGRGGLAPSSSPLLSQALPTVLASWCPGAPLTWAGGHEAGPSLALRARAVPQHREAQGQATATPALRPWPTCLAAGPPGAPGPPGPTAPLFRGGPWHPCQLTVRLPVTHLRSEQRGQGDSCFEGTRGDGLPHHPLPSLTCWKLMQRPSGQEYSGQGSPVWLGPPGAHSSSEKRGEKTVRWK